MGALDFAPEDWRTWRRLRALRLKEQGRYQRDLAEAPGVSEDAVSRWLARARDGGPEALLARPSPGRPPKLTSAQELLVPESLGHGAEAYGFRGEVWTCARVARVIEQGFGVRSHKGHVGRPLQGLRGTPQAPIRRALQRDEGAIRRGRDEAWPDRLRRARRERRVPVFEDEAGSYLLPGVVRTYAPEARTPVVHEKQTRDHLSVMGGMTPQGQVYTLARQESLQGWQGIESLAPLRRGAGERLLVIRDGSPIQRREAVNESVARTKGKVHREALPGYAPDLNPWDEGGWHHLKGVAMRNLACRDWEELHERFHLAVGRLRQKPHLVQSFFARAGLGLEKVRPPLRGGQ